MIRGVLIVVFIISCIPFSQGKTGILDIKITVRVFNTPVKSILQKIETEGGVNFSYNPQLIDENKVVSLSIDNQTIRYGLNLIFDGNIRFKEVGKHIVLLKKVPEQKAKKEIILVFKGSVMDAETTVPIKDASIYEVDSRTACLSDEKGAYLLEVKADDAVRSVYISKKGYKPKVIVVNAENRHQFVNNVQLEPKIDSVQKIAPGEVRRIDQNFKDLAISGEFVSYETYIHGENLDEINETRWLQLSLVPSVSIGSNLSTNALIYNHASLNVLAGFSKGVRGGEVGGLLNIVKENVVGGQVAGIVNLVGGDVTGAQVGGISNLVQGNITGAQVGGISSIMKRDLKGAQVSGITSIIRGGFTGAQIAGISNVTIEKSTGVQISGIFNVVRDSLFGGQISGIANVSNGGSNFFQVAGISNYTNNNIGFQVSGIQNFSKINNGIQIGLVNSSIDGNGVALGLFNYVKNGYHKTEVSANEVFPVNLTFKTGNMHFYNTYNFGIRFGSEMAYAGGLGFGSRVKLSKKKPIGLNIDLSGQLVFENDFKAFEFAQLYKLSTTIDYKLADWISIFAGPSINYNLVQFEGVEGNYNTSISFSPISDKTYASSRSIFWIGGQIGVRL